MAKINNCIDVDLSFLRLRIFTLGGNSTGESFLVLFVENENVVYSIIIDSFTTCINGKEINLPKQFIDHFKIKKLDCIIWTHPHDDHTKGLDQIVDTFYGKNTIGFIPKYVYANKHDVVKISDYCLKVRKLFTKKFKKNKLITIDCAEKENRLLVEKKFVDNNTKEVKTLQLFFLTPIGSEIDKYMANDIKMSQSQLNNLSLSMIMSFDSYCFYFGGDTPNSMIDRSCKEKIEKCKWTTIPHHGSSTSSKLRSLLPKDLHCASCTTFFKYSLPDNSILSSYLNNKKECFNTNVDVTQKIKNDTYTYGVIEYEYDFHNRSNTHLSIRRYGNAYRYIAVFQN